MIKTCEVCGGKYKTSHKNRKHCSRKCQHISQKQIVKGFCFVCGKAIEFRPSENRKYCSKNCFYKDKKKILKKICKYCGREYLASYKKQKYCSIGCKGLAQTLNKIEKICENCGKRFYINPHKICESYKAKYCSQICKGKAWTGENNPNYGGKYYTEDSIRKMADAKLGSVAWNRGLTKETNEKLKIAGGNQKLTKAKMEIISWCKGLTKETDARLKKISDKLKITLQKPEIKKQRSIIAANLWKNPEYQQKMAKALFLKPNKLEQFFNEITPDCVRYTGDGQFFIITKKRTHNPDCKIKGQKKVIELFGEYWHKKEELEELIKEYAEVDWECLILWESEIYNETEKVKKQVDDFIKT